MTRLAIFDCDGTLVDGQANIVEAMNRCFRTAGREAPPPENSRRVVGLSMVEAMRIMLPGADDDEHLALADGYKTAFHAMRAEGIVSEPLYPGIRDLLDRLEANGWLLAIATGKSDRGLGLCLEGHGLAHRFVSLQTADRHPSKPHPSMIEAALAEAGTTRGRTAMIGDTSYDMAMARAAGVLAVGVAWGYHPVEELVAAGAEHIAHAPADLPIILETIP